MNQNQQEQQFGMRESFNLFYGAAKVHAMCFYPFLRTNFGTDALGFPALFALLLMLVVGGLARMPEMMPYLGVWLLALLIQRAKTAKLVRQGVVWHSRCEGYPQAGMRFTRKESTARRTVEPLLCFFCGLSICTVSQPLGVFIMTGVFSLLIVEGIHQEIDRRRLAAMRDAEIEQKWYAARYRGEVED